MKWSNDQRHNNKTGKQKKGGCFIYPRRRWVLWRFRHKLRFVVLFLLLFLVPALLPCSFVTLATKYILYPLLKQCFVWVNTIPDSDTNTNTYDGY